MASRMACQVELIATHRLRGHADRAASPLDPRHDLDLIGRLPNEVEVA